MFYIGIMKKFRKIVYAEHEEETEEAFDDLIGTVGHKYPNLQSYLEKLV